MIAPVTDTADKRPTVLVVEDNVELRFLVSDVLRSAGFIVIEAATTDEAVAYLHTPNDVSLVFSDIMVPGKFDGIGLAKMLEKDFPRLKIILTSGQVPPEAVPPNMKMIKKPYILARVVSEVRLVLGLEPKE